MNGKCAAFAIASVFVLAALCSSAPAQSVEEQIKKIETDRAAAVVKGDVAKLEKETDDDYTLSVRQDVGQIANGERVQIRPKQTNF